VLHAPLDALDDLRQRLHRVGPRGRADLARLARFRLLGEVAVGVDRRDLAVHARLFTVYLLLVNLPFGIVTALAARAIIGTGRRRHKTAA
jgi:hypothetical protein